jgi:hypothetical protein
VNNRRKLVILSLLFILFLQEPLAAMASPFFPTETRYPVGVTPLKMMEGDFNRDGTADVIIANSSSKSLSILIGNADGTFSTAIDYPLVMPAYPSGVTPTRIAIGDFNNDTYPDIAVTSFNSYNGLFILLNDGYGRFSSPQIVPHITSGDEIIADDFNGDGFMDLALDHMVGGKHTFSILQGDGQGAFTIAGSHTITDIVESMVSGDFNRDGKADIALILPIINKLAILLNNGSGYLDSPVLYDSGSNPTGIVNGLFNDDLLPDLAITTGGTSGALSIFIGQGDGSFVKTLSYPVNKANAITSGDLDGDGKTDLATVSFGNNRMTLLKGNGDGTFLPGPHYLTGKGPVGILAIDLNGDSHSDLITINQGSHDLSVWLGEGSMTWGVSQIYDTGTQPTDIALGDFNGDGLIDAVVTYWYGFSILSGSSTTTLGTSFAYGGGNPTAVIASDFNGDGFSDIALMYTATNTVDIYMGSAGLIHKKATLSVGNSPSDIAVGDFNRDGKPDLAAVNNGSFSVSILLGSGDGSFTPGTEYSVNNNPTNLALGDYNKDGNLDIAVTYVSTAEISILPGTDSGTFGGTSSFIADGIPAAIVSNDFNEDGSADLAISVKDTNTIYVYMGSEDSSFNSVTAIPLEGGLSSMSTGDFNGDGKNDLAVAASTSHKVYIAPGNGDGTFMNSQSYGTGALPSSIAALDFNRDGKSDLAIANKNGDDVSLLLSLPSTGRLEFDSSTYTAVEGSGMITINVVRQGGASGVTSVVYGTMDGSAVSGTDYTAVSGNLTFADGETIKSFDIPLLDNSPLGGGTDKTFTIMLSAPSGGVVLGTVNSAIVTIVAGNTPVQGAYKLQIKNPDAPFTAGEKTTVTLSVYRADGSLDTSFNGVQEVTVSGYLAAPSGTFGSWTGSPLLQGATSQAVAFVNGEALFELTLHSATPQQLQFKVDNVTSPSGTTLLYPNVASVHSLQILRQPVGPNTPGGGQLAVQPRVRVTDLFGNPIAGILIQATRLENGKLWALTGNTSVTGIDGIASFIDLQALNHMNTDQSGAQILFSTTTSSLTESSSGFTLLRSTTNTPEPVEPTPSEPIDPSGPTNPADSTAPDDSTNPKTPTETNDKDAEKPGQLPFSDITGHWAYHDIEQLYIRGLIKGYPDGAFRPNSDMTRAEISILLVNALQLPTSSDTTPFKDIAGHWAVNAIAQAHASGIIIGYPDHMFEPNEYVTREQSIAMVVRAFLPKQAVTPGNQYFSDEADISDWALSSIRLAIERQLIAGYPDGSFKPQAPITRAEVSKIIAAALKQL